MAGQLLLTGVVSVRVPLTSEPSEALASSDTLQLAGRELPTTALSQLVLAAANTSGMSMGTTFTRVPTLVLMLALQLVVATQYTKSMLLPKPSTMSLEVLCTVITPVSFSAAPPTSPKPRVFAQAALSLPKASL